jgi:hypothetical protein
VSLFGYDRAESHAEQRTPTLLLKLVLTPLLIAAASLAAGRWGAAVSGWFVGLPLTSGPVAFFLALERGLSFAAAASIGSLAGAAAEAAFCLAYAATVRARWPAALAVASSAFAVVAALLQRLPLSLAMAGGLSVVSLVVAMRLMPRHRMQARPPAPPSWDLAARMTIATVLVLVITALAPVLGPTWSGILATFPIYAAILTVFAHRVDAASSVEVLRGLLLGLFAFVGFFVVLGALIEWAGIAGAFTAASITALTIQGGSLWLVLRAREISPAHEGEP